MIRWLRELSWPELRHHPWRNAAALIAVMLGVALAFSVHLINQSALSEFSSAVRSVNGEPDFELRGPRAGFDEAFYGLVAQHPAVAIASPVIEIDTLAFDAQGERVPLKVIGLDALVAAPVAPALMPRPDAGSDRMALLDPGAIFLNAQAQQRLAISVKASVTAAAAAIATCGWRATRAYSASSNPARWPRSSKSASPLTARTAELNSLSADWLISCTANASATPSITASSAARLRHGWWRSSGHDR